MFGLKAGQVGKLGAVGGSGGAAKRPAVTLDFSDDTVFDPRITFTRASSGSYYDRTGVLRAANTNVPRIDYGPVPSGVTNWVPNSIASGAVIGNPGTAPTGWNPTGGGGVGRQIVGIGTTADGIPYIDVRFFGVISSPGQLKLNITLMSTPTPAIFGQSWTGSCYIQLLADASTVPIGGLNLTLTQSGTAANVYLSGGIISLASLATFQRQSSVLVTNSSTITGATLSIWSTGATTVNGDTIDVTLRIGAPQLEKSASLNPWVPTSGAVATSGASALGLLVEEIRTNLLLQSADVSNAAWLTLGTTSAAPTVTGNQVVAPDGTTTAAKVAYPSVAAGGPVSVVYQGITATAAVYTFSAWLKGAVGGEKVYLSCNVAGAPFYSVACTLTTAWQRFTLTTPALTATTWYFVIGTDTRDAAQLATSAQTVHVWGAQTELGQFVTSYIPTTAASATRNGDLATMSMVGTWVDGFMTSAATVIFNQLAGGSAGILLFSDGTDNQRAANRGIAGVIAAAYVVAGVATAQPATATAVTIGLTTRSVMRMSATGVSVAANSSVVATGTGAPPTGINVLALGRNNVASSLINGWIKKVAIWKRLLTDAEMVIQSNPAL